MRLPLALAALLMFTASAAAAQSDRGSFFDDQSVLHLTLVADFGQFRHDARDDKAPYRVARLIYADSSGQHSVPVRIRPRGIWRRNTCDTPPIRLNFDKDSTHGTIFTKQNRLKLAIPCKNNDESEQNLLSEFQLYRVHNVLTPFSFKARLARATFVDAKRGDTLQTRYAFLGEEPEDAAKRMGGKALDTKGARGDDLEPDASALFGIFQYFIGNTDFSTTELHNVLLLQRDSIFGSAIPVARDFDWTGAVNPPYAKPDFHLRIKRVTDRLMRGDCASPDAFLRAFDLFRAKRIAIYALYTDSLATALQPAVVRWTLKYFDDFYDEINDPRRAAKIVAACAPN